MRTKKMKDSVVESYTHNDSKRKVIPTEQMQPFVSDAVARSVPVSYEKRNPDLDPQLIWRGKYDGDEALTIDTKPLFIQEKINPKAIIENLRKQAKENQVEETGQFSMFDDSWGIDSEADKMDFYQHDENWTNRMILGDSLQVMASLSNREGLRGKVQCIYMDPPYGIKFNSNFQWSTTTRDVKDGKPESMSREPEMVKAFRDTWKDGVNSYLSYLRDRLIVAKELLTDSGSIFIQISDENVHRVKVLLDEIFGEDNSVSLISFSKNSGFGANLLATENDYLLWYAKNKNLVKYRQLLLRKTADKGGSLYTKILLKDGTIRSATEQEKEKGLSNTDGELVGYDNITKPGPGSRYPVEFQGETILPDPRWWGTPEQGMKTAIKAGRVVKTGKKIAYLRKLSDFPMYAMSNVWTDTVGQNQFGGEKRYVVQTALPVIQRCVLMTTDPGDLVLDPTCGSGSTAYVAEQWGRRWITIDTSRVAVALARARLMGAKFPYYLKKDSKEGLIKEAELSHLPLQLKDTFGSLKAGFVYERVPHITLESIANNEEINVIYDKWEQVIEPLLSAINTSGGFDWKVWEVPRNSHEDWSKKVKQLHSDFWEAMNCRQKEIDSSIAAKAEFQNLYDKPYEDKSVIRVTGPFTVESLSPHRIMNVDADGNQIDPNSSDFGDDGKDFVPMILENLRSHGIQQTHKAGFLSFTSLEEWPGNQVCAVGTYLEGTKEKRAAILVGPEFGTLSRPDIMEAAREALECGCNMLVACAFHFDAQSTEVMKLGKLSIMKVMMNTDLMMGESLKGKGNLFVAFGEPDIVVENIDDENISVHVRGVDVFFPNTGEVRSDNEDGIACWFVDTDYDQESFFVRQAYFLGAKDPYDALKRTLKADIDADVWASINSNVSRPFKKPTNGQIAVKVINHLGDEVMKVLRV